MNKIYSSAQVLTVLACVIQGFAQPALQCSEDMSLLECLWDLPFNQPIETEPDSQGCVRNGAPLPIGPPMEDTWFYSYNCKTYKGSVGCTDEEYNDEFGMVVGRCTCNQGDDQIFDNAGQICLGKVGAICTAEVPSFIPEKKCVENAECRPDQDESGEWGHTVGKCFCVDGYMADPQGSGTCVEDPAVPEKKIPRVPSTTQPPEMQPPPLPLDLLLGASYAPFGESCYSEALLKKTYCDTHKHTVSCVERQCQCNMEDYQYSPTRNMCVGLAGSYCLARPNLLGQKSCILGASCVPFKGNRAQYSFGVCQCNNNDENEDGTCGTTTTTADPSSTEGDITTDPSGEVPSTTDSSDPGQTTSQAPGPPPTTDSSVIVTIKPFLFISSVIVSFFVFLNY